MPRRRLAPEGMSLLEHVLTDPELFGLTEASPVQRAACRILDGCPLGSLGRDPDVVEALGGEAAVRDVPLLPPAEFLLVAGVRGGKSLIAAACAVRATQTVSCEGLRPGEVPRVSVLSFSRDAAKVVFDHICGSVEASPELRGRRVGKPTRDTIVLRHPTGRKVEIKVVALDDTGGVVGGRWSAGVVFDEAPRLAGDSEKKVNYSDARRNLTGRMLPGAQIVNIGSPWAPRGPIFKLVEERFGRPGRDVVVMRATGPQLNPSHWTPVRVERERRDPIGYAQNVEAKFVSGDSGFVDVDDLDACVRDAPRVVPREQGARYVAAMDQSGGGANAWTLIVVSPERDRQWTRVRVCLAREWRGKGPEEVLREIASLCGQYGLQRVHGDQYSGAALQALGRRHGLDLRLEPWTAQTKIDAFQTLATLVQTQSIELPRDQQLRSDVLSVKRTVTTSGQMTITLGSHAGRHGDYAPALARACHLAARRRGQDDPPPRVRPPTGIAAQLRDDVGGASELEIGPDGRAYLRRRRVGGLTTSSGGGF